MHDACCQVRQGASPMWVTIPEKKKLHLRRDLYSSPVQNKTMIIRWCKDEDIRKGLQCFLVLPIVQNQQRHFVLVWKPHRHNAIRPIRLLTARCPHPELWTFSPCPDEKAQLSWCPWSVLYVAGQMHSWLYSLKNLSFTPLDNWRLSNEFQDWKCGFTHMLSTLTVSTFFQSSGDIDSPFTSRIRSPATMTLDGLLAFQTVANPSSSTLTPRWLWKSAKQKPPTHYGGKGYAGKKNKSQTVKQ